MQEAALHFFNQHNDTLAALGKVYKRTYTIFDPPLIQKRHQTIRFVRLGSLYQVIVHDFVGKERIGTKSWLACYGWYANGHLMELGGDRRYCFFDPIRGVAYLESGEENAKVESFYEIKNDEKDNLHYAA